jgi:hypothetical protein
MEKKLVDRAIKSFGQTATEADLFGPPTGGKDDRVANAADIDQAMDDLIREKQLADEIDGAAPPRANADKPAFDIDGARVAIGEWAGSVELSYQILNDAQKALADTPLGGAHKPWQVSLVQRGAEISFLCTGTIQLRGKVECAISTVVVRLFGQPVLAAMPRNRGQRRRHKSSILRSALGPGRAAFYVSAWHQISRACNTWHH